MANYPGENYKGYDIYPLVTRYEGAREWYERRDERAYSAAVVICREGNTPEAECARIFPLKSQPWECVGLARQAAIRTGEDIIDGLVPGQSVATL